VALPPKLHELESAVMHVVWSRAWSKFSVADVRDALAEDRELAYTTVMTTVARLFEKKLLSRRRDGRRFVYAPRYTREAYVEATAREMLDASVGPREAMALLVDKVSEASTAELDRLAALIRKRRRELGR
jgi:predicted transcriptional regulator